VYTWDRCRQINPAHAREAREWALAVTARAREITGKHLDGWVRVMSPDAGMVSWSCWDESLQDIEALVDAFDTDATIAKLTSSAESALVGPVLDAVYTNFHHSFVQGEHSARYVVSVEATLGSGRFAEALVSGQKIAEHATSVTGRNTAFLLNFTGPYNGVRWVTGYPDIDSVDMSERSLMDDPAWRALLGSARIDFGPSTARILRRRLT
jgi:hypothetical protein